MNDIIDELGRLHAASTPGDWKAFDEVQMMRIGKLFFEVFPNDAAFIVAAHNHLPALLATLREMREALDIIATCPDDAVHLMPMAAQAALSRARERLGAK